MLNENEKEVLRVLAKKYASYASLPLQTQKKKLWESINTYNMERPMVLFDQLPWNELDVDGSLICVVNDPYWRYFEVMLRREIYKWEHMPADMVLLPYLLLPSVHGNTGYGVATHVHTLSTDKTSDVLSQSYDCMFNSMEDVEKIQIPRLITNREAEKMISEQAAELFDGIIDFRFAGMIMHLGLWDTISFWMGVTEVFTALYDNPDMLHAIMERLTVGNISLIEEMNREKIFDLYTGYCHCSHTFLPDDYKKTEAVSSNSWAFGLAQLFTSVSPETTNEFEVAYMKRIFPYIGNIYYGCCDRLDDRIEVILQLPNIRKISCSPWSNPYVFAEKLPRDKVMSVKPNPAYFAAKSFSLEAVKSDLSEKIKIAKNYNTNIEFIFKDVSTVNYNPQALWETSKMAVELFESW